MLNNEKYIRLEDLKLMKALKLISIHHPAEITNNWDSFDRAFNIILKNVRYLDIYNFKSYVCTHLTIINRNGRQTLSQLRISVEDSLLKHDPLYCELRITIESPIECYMQEVQIISQIGMIKTVSLRVTI